MLLCAPTCWFVRTRIEISFGELFGNFDGFAPWCLGVCVHAGRAWGKRTLHIVGSSSSDYLHQWCATLFGRFSLCRDERGSIVVDVAICFWLVIVAVKRLHLVIFFYDSDDREDEVLESHQVVIQLARPARLASSNAVCPENQICSPYHPQYVHAFSCWFF